MGGPEAPKAPEVANEDAAAKKKMGDVMPPDIEKEVQDRPIDKADLDKYTKGYPEVAKPAKEQQNIIDIAKKALADANNGVVPHYTHYEVTGADSHEYVYIRDIFHEPKDRLFRSEEAVVDPAKEYADATLKYGYQEAGGDQAKKIVKAVTKLLEGNPPTIVVDKSALVNNRILTKEEAFNIKGDVAFAIKIKGKVKVYFGWAKV